MKLKVLGSGSSGNSYALIADNGEILAIEAGCKFLDFKKMIDWKIANVVGCIVSHEHGDHARYIKDFMKSGIPVYTAFETQTALETITGERTIAIPPRRPRQIGSFTVTPFNVPHDTEIECYGYLIEHEEMGKLLFLTDLEYCKYDFWNKHQTLDAYEKKKERDRLYQQNRRKKQKNLIEQKSPDKSSDVVVSDKEEEKEEDKEKENIKENSLSTDSGDLFDFDDAWKKTFSIYPKKTAYSTSKTAWMDKVLEVIEENQPDIARLLYKATEAYLSDYQEKNPDDTDFRYIPKYVDWLKNDCDYWLQIAEKRGDDS